MHSPRVGEAHQGRVGKFLRQSMVALKDAKQVTRQLPAAAVTRSMLVSEDSCMVHGT